MRVLVTGYRGFIGTPLMARLRELGHETLGIDREDGLDILVCSPMVRSFDPQMVFHLAAEHFIPWCNAHPRETWQVNVMGTLQLIDGLTGSDSLRSLVMASSAAVYGFAPYPMTEDQPLRPKDVYGLSKMEAEGALRLLSRQSLASVTALRLSNVIGPGDQTPHLAPALAKGGKVTLGNLWPLRDYIAVQDVVDAMIMVSGALGPGFRAFNVSTGIGTSPEQLVEMFRTIRKLRVMKGPGRNNDGHLVLDPKKLRREVGWKATTQLQEVIAKWDD